MSKPMIYPDKPLAKFKELGVTGNIKARVLSMDEKFRTKDTAKGAAGSFYKTAIILKDASGTIGFDRWIPAKELPFKLNDVININEVHSDYNDYFKAWQIKTCSRSNATIAEPSAQRKADETAFLGKMDEINPIVPKSFEEVKTQTVIIPAQPEHRPYFPAMSIFELRDYHLREQNGAIRGHIENIIMRKQKEMRDEEAKIQRTRIIELLEGMKK